MKNSIRFVFGFVIAVLALAAAAQPKSIFFPSNVLPPPNATYVSPAQWHALYANGIVISNVTHRAFTEQEPPPPLGTSSTHTFNSELDFSLSLDFGKTFSRITAPAQVTVNLQAVSGGSGGVQTYNTEMLQLNLSGGNLPSGIMVRESPSKRSLGQTIVTPTGGGFMISSFFDVFTEVSTDGGNTWSPTSQSGHMDMRADPTLVPPIPNGAQAVPPLMGVFVTPTLAPVGFANGIMIKDVRDDLFSSALNLAGLSSSLVSTDQFSGTIVCQLSTDGGKTFNRVSAPVQATVLLQTINPGPPTLYDTEMTQLDITFGGGPTGGVKVRESPTKASYGEMSVGTASDASYRISSFFDIFTEVSLDGGQTWQASSNGPTHVELQKPARFNQFQTATMPPSNGVFNFPLLIQYQVGTSSVQVKNVAVRNMSPSLPLPPPGQSQPQTFTCDVDMSVSLDGGQTFSSGTGRGSGFVTVSNTSPAGASGPQYYNTELLQLNISGGTLPVGLMVRESPSKASLGRTSAFQDPASGQFKIDSFFDVFTELSLDNGTTWHAALTDPSTIPLVPVTPPYAPYVISCPSNIIVFATSPSGAIVNYSFPPLVFFPDCPFCCFAATGAPPSGSLFPIGTTTVTGSGWDGCGEHPTCTFTVTVLPSLIYAGLADWVLGRAVLSTSTVNTNPYIIISNLFSDSSDGFHLALGSASSALLGFQPFAATANCPTDLLTTATGLYNGDPNHVLGAGAYHGGTKPMVQADFSSLGASQVTVQVHDGNDNHLVYSAVVANNSLVDINLFFPPPCSNANTTVYTYGETADHICYRFCRFGCDCSGTNCYIERVACFSPVLASLPVNVHLSGLDVKAGAASPPGSFTIQTEELGLLGARHQAVGMATLDSRPGILMVNNIGASGQDGVGVDLGMAGQYDLMLAPTMIVNPGACLELFAYGKFKGTENAPIGLAALFQQGAGAGMLVEDDFSEVNSPNSLVYVFDQNGYLVKVVSEPNGVLGTLMNQGNLVGCGLRARPTPGFDLRFDSPFIFIPEGSTAQFMGTELQILAANPDGPFTSFSEFGVGGCNLGELAITGETAQPVLNGVVKRTDGTFEVDGQGMSGAMYQLLASPQLGSGAQWMPVSTAISGPDGTFQLFDPRSANAQLFYQVQAQGLVYQ